MADRTISLGHEIEFESFPGLGSSGDPEESRRPPFLRALLAEFMKGDSVSTSGQRLFFPWGCAYPELSNLLELNTVPANSIEGILDSLMIAASRANAAAKRAFPGGSQSDLFSLTCVNDDLAGPPPALAKGTRSSRGTGLHTNVSVANEATNNKTADLLILVCVALTSLTGAGGFVRSPRGGYHFVRDPRALHTFHRTTERGLRRSKPMSKSGGGFNRYQLLALGYSPAVADVEIRSALLILAALSAQRLPRFELISAPWVGFPATSSVELSEGGQVRRVSALDLCRLIAERLLPFRDEEEALVSGARAGFDKFCRLIDAVASKPAREVASVVPVGWAIQQAAYEELCDAESQPFPSDASPQDGELMNQLAVLSVRSGSVFKVETTLEFLHEQADLSGSPEEYWWTYRAMERAPSSPRACGDPGWELQNLVRRGGEVSWEKANNSLAMQLRSRQRQTELGGLG
ncbi:MAG: hypothetical protein V3W41_05590 [Planctomycetota bacterium]